MQHHQTDDTEKILFVNASSRTPHISCRQDTWLTKLNHIYSSTKVFQAFLAVRTRRQRALSFLQLFRCDTQEK